MQQRSRIWTEIRAVVAERGAEARTPPGRMSGFKQDQLNMKGITPFGSKSNAEVVAESRAVGVPKYNALSLAEFYTRRPFQVIARTLDISVALGSVAASILVDRQRGDLQANMRLRARQLRLALTKLGATFVKLGQALSTRPDLCPPEYLEELALLQDSLPTFATADAFGCIERELGEPLEQIFSAISAKPIAAASLGQVYKAELRQSGQIVAVKVQRPGIGTAIGLDFFLIRNIFSVVDKYADFITTSLVALLDEFAERVYQELNYVQEGKNAERFARLYGDQPGVVVPGIVWEYTSANVLCLEWIEGVKLSDAAQMEQSNTDVLQLVDIGIQCSLRQLLEFGYFHADPHPGNLLATPDGRLAFLDFGMMSETPSTARYAIIGHVVHLVNRDYEAMARDYYALDFLEPSVDVSPIVPALRGFFDDVLQASVSELNFKTIVDGLGSVLYQFPFNVPAYYALILRSLTVLEGLALFTDPNFKVLAAAYPYMAKRLLTDPNPYLRDSLIELLFRDGTFRWNRLENLLKQGKRDRDYRASQALQPVLDLLLGPDGAPLRTLVVRESIRVSEALVLGSVIEGLDRISGASPSLSRPPLTAGPVAAMALAAAGGMGVLSGGGLLRLKDAEQAEMMELRRQVLSCWALLQSTSGFDPASLLPLVEIIRQEEVQEMGTHIATGVLQRFSARMLQIVLRPQPSLSSTSIITTA